MGWGEHSSFVSDENKCISSPFFQLQRCGNDLLHREKLSLCQQNLNTHFANVWLWLKWGIKGEGCSFKKHWKYRLPFNYGVNYCFNWKRVQNNPEVAHGFCDCGEIFESCDRVLRTIAGFIHWKNLLVRLSLNGSLKYSLAFCTSGVLFFV